MVFGEVKFREPKKARRPDRDRRWACLAYEIPRPEDLPIFLDRKTADSIERHALRDTSVELGGILLGHECVDDQTGEPYVWVTECLEAKHYENTQASFTYTHDSWEEITRERDRLHPDLDIVGWYHTHPDFGIFLSSHDLFIHRNFFDQPLQVAYVVDPIRQTRGFFRWRDGGLDQVGGYYLSADRGDRIALARLVNDLESIANADPGGGGGGLSPRLEAELIAMLSRPHQATTSTANQAQVAALFGTMGLFAGVLLVAAVAWLYTLTQQLHDQAEALTALKESAEQTETVQKVALDALLAKSGEGGDRKSFLDNYRKARKDLEEALDKVKTQEKQTILAMADNKKLEGDLVKVTEAKQKALDDAKSVKEDLDKAREKYADLKDEAEAFYQTKDGQIAVKYSTALYAAIAGWVLALLSSLGLLALWLSRTPLEPGSSPGLSVSPINVPGVSPEPAPSQEPPHQIV